MQLCADGNAAVFRDTAREIAVRVTSHPNDQRLSAWLADRLATCGAPVLRPLEPAPRRVGDRFITLWPWCDAPSESVDWRALGGVARAVRECTHEIVLNARHDGVELPSFEQVFVDVLRGRAAQVEAADIVNGRDSERLTAFVDHSIDRLSSTHGARVLAHGDLTPANLVVTSEGDLVAIDLDKACLAPPACDLAIPEFLHWFGYPAHIAQAFRMGYGVSGVSDADVVAMATFRAAYSLLSLGVRAPLEERARVEFGRRIAALRDGRGIEWRSIPKSSSLAAPLGSTPTRHDSVRDR
ncbi:MAG: phosphotransferase [Actinomycetota bacterium]